MNEYEADVIVAMAPDSSAFTSGSVKDITFLGCCGDNMMIDFSKMELFPDFFPESRIVWSDSKLWLLLCLILVILPMWITICAVFLRNKKLHNSRQGDIITTLTTGVFLVPSFIGFMKVIDRQPHWDLLESNMAIGLGYFLLLIGLCHIHQGVKSLEVFQLLNVNSDQSTRKIEQKEFITCASSIGMESTLCLGNSLLHLGASLIYASQAGVLITLALGFSYIEIMHIRRFLGLKMFY